MQTESHPKKKFTREFANSLILFATLHSWNDLVDDTKKNFRYDTIKFAPK